MGNCLITRLKESVLNNDLPVFGVLTIKVIPTVPTSLGQNIMRIQNSKGITLKTSDSLPHIAEVPKFEISEAPSLVSEITINTNGTRLIYFDSSVAYNVYLSEKYSILRLDAWDAIGGARPFGFDLNELKYTSGLSTIYALYESGTTGSLKDVGNCTSLIMLYLQGTQVTGDLKDIQNLTGLTSLGLRLTANNISGELDYLVDNIAALHIVKTLSVQGNGVVTLDGTILTTNAYNIVFDGNGGYLVLT